MAVEYFEILRYNIYIVIFEILGGIFIMNELERIDVLKRIDVLEKYVLWLESQNNALRYILTEKNVISLDEWVEITGAFSRIKEEEELKKRLKEIKEKYSK